MRSSSWIDLDTILIDVSMKQLTESDVLRIMREEWDGKVQRLREEVGLVMKDDPVVSPELKIHHKKSGILYTVDSVGPRDVILRTPEGEKFIIDNEELEKDYELA